jgi:CelD/BcsL family acetyltransferase involved in cellulose biosynthesis
MVPMMVEPSEEIELYSMGHLIIQRAIEDCIMNHIKEFDFLKGDEPYKWAWTKNYRQNFFFAKTERLRLLPPNTKQVNRFYFFVTKIHMQKLAQTINAVKPI